MIGAAMAKGSVKNSGYYKCYVPIYNVGTDFVIFEIGSEKCEPLHYWGPYEKHGYVFHYCEKGKGVLTICDKTYSVKAGDIFYIAPDDRCFYQADENDPWEYKWIYFGGMKAKSVIGKSAFCDTMRVAPCNNAREFCDMVDAITDKKASELNDLKAMSALYKFLSWLLENYPNGERKSKIQPNEKYWTQILNYIYLNFPYNLTINEISKYVGLERTYIYKLFLKNAGISAIEFIENLRISIACDKIAQRDKSLLAIASEVGFNDYAWFNKVFKRIVGILPSEYLQNYETVRSAPSFQIVQNRVKDYYRFFSRK